MDPLSLRLIRPQRLILASRIVLDHRIGRIQHHLGRTVILLQLHDAGLRIYLLKIQNVADIGATEFIDGLIVVSHHAKVPVPVCQQSDQFKLGRVGILILIHTDISKTILIPGKNLGVRLKKLHRLHDQIVKVQGVILL